MAGQRTELRDGAFVVLDNPTLPFIQHLSRNEAA